MKALVVGIDGGTAEIFSAYPMPFLQNFGRDNAAVRLTIDLHSRGWSEIVTGQHASETRAFYIAPRLDGTHEFAPSFRLSDALKLPGIRPIWDVAADAGLRSGILNVPTATPVVPVQGFMVGSAGGGMKRIEGLPEGLAYPDEIRGELERLQYIIDLRLPTSEVSNLEELFRRLGLMEERRVDAFIALARKDHIGFGFFVNRGNTVIQYLAMYHVQQQLQGSANSDALSRRWETLLTAHYAHLDRLLRRLYEELEPEHFIVTADHSTVPFTHRGSVTPFLAARGWHFGTSFLNRERRKARRLVKRRLGRSPRLAAALDSFLDPIDWGRSRAFGHQHVHGVYVNDARFRGPVAAPDMPALVDDICAAFNASPEAAAHAMHAVPYRREFLGTRFADCLPDVFIDRPDNIFFDNLGSTLVRRNPNFAPIAELSDARFAMHSGQKGRHPVFVATKNTAALIQQDDPRDLTLVYRLIQRALS